MTSDKKEGHIIEAEGSRRSVSGFEDRGERSEPRDVRMMQEKPKKWVLASSLQGSVAQHTP